MYSSKLLEHKSMSQEEVCAVLRLMDSKINIMFSLIIDCSNILETELTKLAIQHLLDKKYRSPKYYGDLSKYALLILKLNILKNKEKLLHIINKLQITRDTSINIINKFIDKTKKYKELCENIAEISYDFYENGAKANIYSSIRNKMYLIENNIKGVRESLYGSILNVESILREYHSLRNKIVLSYLKLSSGEAYRITTRYDDSFQNGVIGIMHAIDKTKINEMEQKIYSFANFLKWHVKNAIINSNFNIRTDLVFDIKPQLIKKMYKKKGSDYIKKLKGENIKNFENSYKYIPNYLINNNENILNNEEKTIIALLNRDPSECIFEYYPNEEEILKEKNRQLKLLKKFT